MTKITLKALLLVFFLSFSLGLSNNNTIHKKKNKTWQSRTQNSLASNSSQPRAVKNRNHNKTSSRSTVSSCQFKKYPPPPKDRSKPPKPIWCYVEAIADLCKLDSFEEQLQSMEVILESLRDAISFYNTKYSRQVGTKYTSSLIHNLAEEVSMQVFWEAIFEKRYRIDIAGQFLSTHSLMYNLPGPLDGEPVLAHEWTQTIYRGLHCLSHGYPPKKEFEIYKD